MRMPYKGGLKFSETWDENPIGCLRDVDCASEDVSPADCGQVFQQKIPVRNLQYGCVAASLLMPISLNIVSVLPHLSFRCWLYSLPFMKIGLR